MAKQPETQDRIVIVAEAPSFELAGAGMAALIKLGFENVRPQLITDILRYKNRTVHEISAAEFATQYVKTHARFTPADLIAHFREAGREAGAGYYAIKKLTSANVIRKNGDDYVRVEALPAPDKNAMAKLPKMRAEKRKQFDIPNKVLIARAIKGRKHITVRELRDLFVAEKRNEKSISPILTAMVTAKKLKHVGDGKYDVVSKPAKPLPKTKKKSAAPAPVINGSGEQAHG